MPLVPWPAADDMLSRLPPVTLTPGDMNLTTLYKPPTEAPTIVYNPRRQTQAEAEAYCQSQGGHLAAYISRQEQYLVEQTLVDKVGTRAAAHVCTVSAQVASALSAWSLLPGAHW